MRRLRMSALSMAVGVALAWAATLLAQNWVVQNGANSVRTNTATTAVAIRQDGTGKLLSLLAGASEVFSVALTGVPTTTMGNLLTTSTDGQVLQNTTASGGTNTVQISPRTKWCGTALNSTSGSSETNCFFAENLPATGAGTITGTFRIGFINNAGTITYPFTQTSGGNLTTLTEVLAGTNVNVLATSAFYWRGRSVIRSPSDGVITLVNNAETDFTRLQFGGTTASFPAWARSAATLRCRLADDSADCDVTARNQNFTAGLVGTALILSTTAPTISSGFGGTPSIAANNGTAAFTINVGTGGAATSGVIGLPTATTGWRVNCDDVTTQSATVYLTKQTATSTTTATIGNFDAAGAAAAWVASNILVCHATAY